MHAGARKLQTSLVCLGMWAGFATASLAQGADAPLTAQERLDAIRHSLVEASLKTPTKVLTTSWIDGQGSLRESSSFKNGMEVRGVQVLSYGRDENGYPKARLHTPVPMPEKDPNKTGLKGMLAKIKQATTLTNTEQDAPACQPQLSAQMNHLVSLDLDIPRGTNPMVLQALLPLVQSQWAMNTAPQGKAQTWLAVNNLPPASLSNQMTSYERALVGNRPAKLPWTGVLKITTEVVPENSFEIPFGANSNAIALNLDFQIRGTEGQLAKMEERVRLVMDIERPQWSAARLSSTSLALLQNQINDWRDQATQLLNCQPIVPVVTAVAGQQLQINAGALTGVRKGDELLVANPARFPAEIAGKQGAPQTVLASVQSVSAYTAQLVVAAGPAQTVQPQWRAWPTEILMKEPGQLTAPQAAKVVSVASTERTVKQVVKPAPNNISSNY